MNYLFYKYKHKLISLNQKWLIMQRWWYLLFYWHPIFLAKTLQNMPGGNQSKLPAFPPESNWKYGAKGIFPKLIWKSSPKSLSLSYSSGAFFRARKSNKSNKSNCCHSAKAGERRNANRSWVVGLSLSFSRSSRRLVHQPVSESFPNCVLPQKVELWNQNSVYKNLILGLVN